MPNQRHADQRFVGVALDRQLGVAFEAARKRSGKTRSEFFREAIIEKLNRDGIAVDPRLALARDRAGDIFSDGTRQVAEDTQGPTIQAGRDINFPAGRGDARYKIRRPKKTK
jgi:CubicO group peptidase (beta-lactamase class C family)